MKHLNNPAKKTQQKNEKEEYSLHEISQGLLHEQHEDFSVIISG
jgi:hypothetical protein